MEYVFGELFKFVFAMFISLRNSENNAEKIFSCFPNGSLRYPLAAVLNTHTRGLEPGLGSDLCFGDGDGPKVLQKPF